MADHKEIIRRNIRLLSDLTICSSRLIDRCAEENILTLDESEQIGHEKDKYERNRAFYDCIKAIEPNRFPKLLELMEEKESHVSREVLAILKGQPSQPSSSNMAAVTQKLQNITLDPPQPAQQPQLSLIEQLVGNKSLLQASAKGQLQEVKMLIGRGADVNAPGDRNRTPLHFAAQYNHKEIAILLIASGARVDAKDDHSMTPFQIAMAEGHSEVGKILLNAGGNLDTVGKQEMTPLHLAAEKGDLVNAKFLVENGANIHVIDDHGWTPLHRGIWYGSAPVVQYLIHAGADVWGRTGTDTALHLAVGSNIRPTPEVTRLVLEGGRRLCGTDPSKMYGWLNALDGSGSTALSLATAKCEYHDVNHEVLRVLLEYGPDIEIRDRNGLTPIEFAKKYGRSKALSHLRAAREAMKKIQKKRNHCQQVTSILSEEI